MSELQIASDLLLNSGVSKVSKNRYKLAFGWYGGKYSHLSWLLPLLPECNHYCEPFGGSAAVLINRKPSPVETYNDLDSEVVNFFKVLREEKDKLIESIVLTPFSREEFVKAIYTPKETISDLERARYFYIRARQARTGLAQTASPGRWATCRDTSRRGMGGAVSRWLGGYYDLIEIASRLIRVQIDNRPAIDVINAYDSKDTLFYCDPPYPHESRGDSKAYSFELTDQEHRELARTLHNVKGKVAVSGYVCELMQELYGDWRRIEAPPRLCHSVKAIRQEALWVNFNTTRGK